MIKKESGFSLVELIITMTIFTLVIAASSQVFTGLLNQFKQQSKIAETNIEGIIGLEMLRHDIEHAGYGLPWNLGGPGPGGSWPSPCTFYAEAAVESKTPWVDRDLNDGPPTNPARGTDAATACNSPGAIRSLNNVVIETGSAIDSDVISVKAANAARNAASRKSTNLRQAPFNQSTADLTTTNPRLWDDGTAANTENFANTDKVIVIQPGIAAVNFRTLINDGTGPPPKFYDDYTDLDVGGNPWAPTAGTETRFVYGIKPAGSPVVNPRMPFNRADYYVRIPGSNFPARCAEDTGILYKGTVNHGNGLLTELPVLDCVANLQVVYRRDTDGDDIPDTESDAGWANTVIAADIRDQVKEVRVYILAHEGQYDPSYTFDDYDDAVNETITIGEFGDGYTLDMNDIGPDDNYHKNFRWKRYMMVIKPMFSR
jgi:prepilin-type N-terminal cleavage/methylation domain-containing protein